MARPTTAVERECAKAAIIPFRGPGTRDAIWRASVGGSDGAFVQRNDWRYGMNITLSIGPLVSLIAGILILIMPRMLNYIVALYLIIIGLLGLFGAGLHLR